MGRNRRADMGIRPFLDAFQVLPPFVYLVPALALFGVGRFTAIMAAVAYAVPIATKLVADGIRGVSPTTVEAARSTGSTSWQMITKVQLPMAREALVLAANQGLLYVLAMVVIGGMVGAGSLGYIVVSGFSPGPAVRQGTRGGHRHRRARDHDRPDRAVLRRAVRQVRTTSADVRGAKKGRSMARGLRRTRHLALATVVGLGLAACGGGNIEEDEPTASDCGDLNIAINPWTGYVSNAHVIGVVAENELGCNVEYPEVKEEVGWQGMSDGSIDTIVENWGHPDLIKKYIDQQGTVEDAGLTGNDGIIGWYVPPWMVEEYPDILDWQNLNKYADMFETSESGDKGQLLDGDPSYVTNDEALVKNLDLDFEVVVGGSEAALIQSFRSGGGQQDTAPGLLLRAAVVLQRAGPAADQAASLRGGLRRRRGEGRLRLPAVQAEQADLQEVRRLRLAGRRPDQELQLDQRGPERRLEVHRRGRHGPGRRRPEVDRRQPGQGRRLARK